MSGRGGVRGTLSYPCPTPVLPYLTCLSGRSVQSPSLRISMPPSRKQPRRLGRRTAGGWPPRRERSSPCAPAWPPLPRTSEPKGRSAKTRSPRLRRGLEKLLPGAGEAGPSRAEPRDGRDLRRRGTRGSGPRRAQDVGSPSSPTRTTPGAHRPSACRGPRVARRQPPGAFVTSPRRLQCRRTG